MSKQQYKPTPLKLLEGNRSRVKDLGKHEPKPKPKAEKPIKELDAAAKRIWKKLAPKLERLNLLTEIDSHHFANVCQTIARLHEIWDKIKDPDNMMLIMTSSVDSAGNEHINVKPNPLLQLELKYMENLRKYATEFGLTPRGRGGLVVGYKEDDGEDLLT